jgi:hypothetical protein
MVDAWVNPGLVLLAQNLYRLFMITDRSRAISLDNRRHIHIS